MTKKRSPAGTIQQRVFDAIVAAEGRATLDSIVVSTGIARRSVRTALAELRKHVPVHAGRGPLEYSVERGTPRPQDLRGRRAR